MGARAVRVLALIACAAPPLAGGCISATWSVSRRYREVRGDDALAVGEDELAAALAALGAPLLVRENGDGAVLAWGWSRERAWSVTADLPLRAVDVSFRYRDALTGLEGLVLFFDRDWRLVGRQRGSLADLLPPSQARARSFDDAPEVEGER